jgi:hypothetical protein
MSDLKPRPTEPTQRLTARPLPRNLDPYKVPETVKPKTEAKLHAPSPRPGALISRDLFDDELRPASWAAFGEGPGAA